MSQDQVVNYVVLIIVVGALVIGLLSMLIGRIVAAWDAFAAWWGVGVQKAIHTRPSDMSSRGWRDLDSESNEDAAISPATTTQQNSNNGVATPATDSNALLLGQARALATMVKAGKIGETEGIKMVFGVSPSSTNPRYKAARAALKAELERLDDHFPRMTPEQKRAREALGIGKP